MLTNLYVKDRVDGQIHRVGESTHDSLYVRNGVVGYYNLQNGEGSLGDYSFVDYNPLIDETSPKEENDG